MSLKQNNLKVRINMKKKISLLLTLVFTFTIMANFGAVNSLGITKSNKNPLTATDNKKNKVSTEKITTSIKNTKTEIKKNVPLVSTDLAITGAVKWIKQKISQGDYKINDWYVLALSLAGEDINADQFKINGKTYLDYKKETINDQATTSSAVTLYAKNIMGLIAAGQDPTYFQGHDLLQEISARVEKGDNTVTGEAWGMIALSAAGADFNRESATKFIEASQNLDGGYGWTQGTTSDIDTTAMVVYALNMCGKDNKDTSLKKSLVYLGKALKYMENDKTRENVESLGQTLMALVSCGENLDSYKINRNSLVNEIISFRTLDGGFKHLQNGSSNELSTVQSLTALEFYRNNKNLYKSLKNNEKNALSPISANIRIEGPDKTIIDKTLELNNRIVFDSNGKAFDTKKITAYAFLMKALNGSAIKAYADYGYGAPYVSAINDIKGGSFGGWDGWMFLVNGVAPEAGMTDVEIKAGDKILVFYGDFGITPINLVINKNVNAGDNVVIQATTKDKPENDVAIIINGTKVGQTKESGILNYKFDKPGVYRVYGEKNDATGKPLDIRSEVTNITVK